MVNLLQGLSPGGSHSGSRDRLPIAQQTFPNNLDNLPKTVFADDVFSAQGLKAPKVGNLGCARLHDDAGGLLTPLLQRSQHFLAFGIGQVFVNQDQIESVRIKQLQRFLCSPYSRRIETRILKKPLKNDEDILVAICDENFLSTRVHFAPPGCRLAGATMMVDSWKSNSETLLNGMRPWGRLSLRPIQVAALSATQSIAA
jgi:hypothetical protein